LQTAINAAQREWILELNAGENYDTATGFTLPAKTGAGWISIRSNKLAELPSDRRVSPSDAPKMPKLRATGNTAVIKTSGAPSNHWRLEGLEITLSTTNLQNTSALVQLGDTLVETSPEKISHYFVIDRCYIHGLPDDSGPWRGILHNADHVTITNSYISEVKLLASVAESHVLVGWSLNGHLLVRNNYIGGAAINSLVGGAWPSVSGMTPMFLTYLANLYEKPGGHQIVRYAADPEGTTLPTTGKLGGGDPERGQTFWKTDTSELYTYDGAAWQKIDGVASNEVCIDGAFWRNESATPAYWECINGNWQTRAGNKTITGIGGGQWNGWGLKNLFEFKHVIGARVEGNVMQNTFYPTFGNQIGTTILLNWTEDQNGPWSGIRDVTFRNNKFRRIVAGVTQGAVARVGTVTSATAGNPTTLVCSAGCGQGGSGTRWVRISGATGQWAGINGDWVATFSSSTTLTIPYNSTGYSSLTGSVMVYGQFVAFAHSQPRRILIENNLWESMAVTPNYTMLECCNSVGHMAEGFGYSYGMGRGALLNMPETIFRHNTMIKPHGGPDWQMGIWLYAHGSSTPGMVVTDNIAETGHRAVFGYYSEVGCDGGFPPYWANWHVAKNVIVQTGQWYNLPESSYYDQYCLGWGWPWKRSGAGVRKPVTGATVTTDATNCGAQNRLTINFDGGHGLFPKMPFKVTAAMPGDIIGSYETPQYRLGTKNLVAQTDYAIEVCTSAPTGSYTGVEIEASAGFADYANKNFRLASGSQYKNWATDGSDPGANQDTVEWATEYAETGQHNAYLDFGVKAFIPSSQGGEFRWAAYSDAPCSWTISLTRAFASSVGMATQTRAGRYGVATVTGLSANTTYWYKVTCDGGRYRDGEFVTAP